MTILALYATAVLLGGMVFFAAVMAPLVFTRLPAGAAGPFIRQVFPVYYLFVLILAALGAVALLPGWPGLVMAAVAVLTLWLRQGLMPTINRLSDTARTTGDVALKRRFDLAHRASVVANLVQMLAVGAVLAQFR